MMKKLFFMFSFLMIVMTVSAQQTSVSDPVKSQLKAVLNSYIDLKNSLVASNAKKSKEKAGELLQNIDKVDESKLDAGQKEVYTKAETSIKTSADQISKAGSLSKQREYFGPLSDDLFKVVKAIKISDDKIYRDYCPMANDNNGGFWLSEKKEIANPYFGSQMLKCGEVKETL